MAKFIIGAVLIIFGGISAIVFKKMGIEEFIVQILSFLIIAIGGLIQLSAFMSAKAEQDRLNLEHYLWWMKKRMTISAMHNKKQGS